MRAQPAETSDLTNDFERDLEAKERQDLERIDRLLRETDGALESSTEVIAGRPDEMAEYFHRQPENTPACALAAQESSWEASAGKGQYDIEGAMRQGAAEGWYDSDKGTTCDDMGRDWERHGLRYDHLAPDDAPDAFATLETSLSEGKAVVAEVETKHLPEWAAEKNGGHALWLTGIEDRKDGAWIICNDSGLRNEDGRRVGYRADHFERAWSSRQYHMIVTRDPILRR